MTVVVCAWMAVRALAGVDGNRLTYLDEFSDPYPFDHRSPRLVTPQWIGEKGVDVAVVLSIDDMSDHRPYETFLRPLLERLKKIEGRSPVSIMCNRPNPDEAHLQTWIAEGVALETHTVNHPCPLLNGGNFQGAYDNYHDCIDQLNRVPGYTPVCFRMPCYDSMNSNSPRFYTELFSKLSRRGHFLEMSSSVSMLFT